MGHFLNVVPGPDVYKRQVVEYAKSIGDTTFQNCIERLKQWEKNSNGRYEIELYREMCIRDSIIRHESGQTSVYGNSLQDNF